MGHGVFICRGPVRWRLARRRCVPARGIDGCRLCRCRVGWHVRGRWVGHGLSDLRRFSWSGVGALVGFLVGGQVTENTWQDRPIAFAGGF
jgi:hypothetical protein